MKLRFDAAGWPNVLPVLSGHHFVGIDHHAACRGCGYTVDCEVEDLWG